MLMLGKEEKVGRSVQLLQYKKMRAILLSEMYPLEG
jgi:hypothetical protein